MNVLMEMLKVLLLTLLPALVSSVCNTTTEWTCPQSSKCIPTRYHCDNVPDCTGSVGSPDETNDCPLPPKLSGFGVSVITSNLQLSNTVWTTPGDRFINVTINITYTNGLTGAKEAVQVYGRPKWCRNMRRECATYGKSMCSFGVTAAICNKLCERCRVDTMRNSAQFDMMSLLKKKATNIKATAYASNFKGNGPVTPPIEVPIPEIAEPVQELRIEIVTKMMDHVWAILSWNKTGFAWHPNVVASNGSIENHITYCRVIELSNGTSSFEDCKFKRLYSFEKSKKKFYDLKYGTKYAFTVKPVSKYASEISGPTATVYLTVPAAPEEKGPLNVLALSFGIAGGVTFLGIVFVTWRKYRRGQGVCDCDDDDDSDEFMANYAPSSGLVAT